MTVVAVVGLLTAGEPALALPHIALALTMLDQGHPPVDTHQHRQADQPLNGDQDQVDPSENQEPEKAVFALYIGKLDVSAAALGTSLIISHNYLISFFLSLLCFLLRFSFLYASRVFWFLIRFYIFKIYFLFFSMITVGIARPTIADNTKTSFDNRFI